MLPIYFSPQAQVFQKLKLMELQKLEREKYEINKQNVETFSRTTNAKKVWLSSW